jgi:hypothetical protein
LPIPDHAIRVMRLSHCAFGGLLLFSLYRLISAKLEQGENDWFRALCDGYHKAEQVNTAIAK